VRLRALLSCLCARCLAPRPPPHARAHTPRPLFVFRVQDFDAANRAGYSMEQEDKPVTVATMQEQMDNMRASFEAKLDRLERLLLESRANDHTTGHGAPATGSQVEASADACAEPGAGTGGNQL